jgi:hypothetical protein
MKKILVLGVVLLLVQAAFAQTSTTGSGNWSDATLWSSGVPAGGTTDATINHTLVLDIGSLTISSGDYIFNASATDLPGGSQLGISVGNGGVWEVAAGTVTLEGNANFNNFSTVTVRSGATLITGSVSMGNNVTVLVEDGGTWIINGDLNSSNQNGTFTIAGLVSISGNFSSSGTADIIGTGDITTGGSMITNGSSTIFNTGTDCNSGPCSGRNLCGFTNTITTASQVKCSGAAGSITLNGTTSASSPVYLWESSTTSQTSGFGTATPTNNATSYTIASTPAQTSWYRRKVTSGGCTGTSIPVKVTVIPSAGGWIGAGADNNWNTVANWCSGLPTATTDVTIPSGVTRMPAVNITTAVARDLIVNPGATITLNASNTLTLSGNFTNNGTLTANSSSTLVFTGTSAQTFGGTAINTLDNLTVNKSSGALTLNAFGTVNNTLTMTAGNVNLNGNPLTLGASGTPGTLAYTAGWLYGGSFTRYYNGGSNVTLGNVAGLFPMGTSTDTRPLYVGANGINPNGYIRVSHTGATTTTNVSYTDNGSTVVRRQDSFWGVSTTLTSGTYSLRAGGTGFGTIANVDHLRLTQSGSAVGSLPANNTGTTTSPLVDRLSLTPANLTNSFYVSSINGTLSPLPVKLISFTAGGAAGGIQLDWKTSQEKDFYYFVLERAGADLQFAPIYRVEGNGGNDVVATYAYLDKQPLSGKNYYRLKMVDLDESFDYSPVVVADGKSTSIVTVYPNPVTENEITITLNDKLASPIQLTLLDGSGTQVLQGQLEANTTSFQLPQNIRPGLYYLRLLSGSGQQILKVAIQ